MQWGKFTPTWGENARRATHDFQKAKKIPLAGFGPRTFEALRTTHRKGSKTDWAFDDYAVELEREEYAKLHVNPEVKIRNGIIQMARYLYAWRFYYGYDMVRPFPLLTLGSQIAGKRYRWDCSGNLIICHYAGGAKNPNVVGGRRLTWAAGGEGYTGSLMAGGRKCNRGELKPGDAVMYGFTRRPNAAFAYGDPTHVAIWEGDGYGNVFTFGSYPDHHCNYNYRTDINCYVTFDVTP
jgi:hypothetical protein